MKPFDLEKAKAGHPVVTRDGKTARIICFDRKGNSPIVALVGESGFGEKLFVYDKQGQHYSRTTSWCDLFMAPVKKEGWVNLYRPSNEAFKPCSHIYSTERLAIENKVQKNSKTVRIEWEE